MMASAEEGETNSDPYNPANWLVTREVQGSATGFNHIGDGAQTVNTINLSRSFSGSETIGITTSIWNWRKPYTLNASCMGTYTHKLTWRGIGPSPNTVLIHLTSHANGQPSASLSCGLGNIFYSGDQELGQVENGYGYRSLSVDGGVATTAVSGSASSTVLYEPSQPHFAGGTNVGFVSDGNFTPKALAITRTGDPTYYRGFGSGSFPVVPIINQRSVLDYGVADIGIPVVNDPANPTNYKGELDLFFQGLLFGRWSTPMQLTSEWSGPTGLHPSFLGPGIAKSGKITLNSAQMNTLRKSGHRVEIANLTVTDPVDGQSRTAKYETRLHCEAEFVNRFKSTKDTLGRPVLTAKSNQPVYSKPGGAGFSSAEYVEFATSFAYTLEFSRSISVALSKQMHNWLGVELGAELGTSDGFTWGITQNIGGESSFDMPGPSSAWPEDTYQLYWTNRDVFDNQNHAKYGLQGFESDFIAKVHRDRQLIWSWVNSDGEIMNDGQ